MYLEGGFAYVPVQKVVTIVVARYRMGISKSLMEASNHFAFVTSDSRFGPLLQVMDGRRRRRRRRRRAVITLQKSICFFRAFCSRDCFLLVERRKV